MKKRTGILIAGLLGLGSIGMAQDAYFPIHRNVKLQEFLKVKAETPVFQGKTGIKDTLQLPFFDDFSRLGVIPNDTLWTDAAVFINADFPINPPSIGVATFDGLDAQGNAYEDIDATFFGPADTLTSQPINLQINNPADSIYLSFFYQAQGLSFEPLALSDSLVLQYKNRIGAWVTVWSSLGITQSDFRMAMVPVRDTSYFHEAFQFRWINYQLYIGNLKQWHLDFVYLDQGRNVNDTEIEDQTMVYLPEFPFNTYTHIPWDHLQGNPGKYLKTSFTVPINNLSVTGETFTVSMRANDPDDVVGAATLNGQSLPGSGVKEFTMNPGIALFSNTQDSSSVRLVTKLSDILGGNEVKENDSAVRMVELANYYAYDDGTAESGYGILNASGAVSMGFEMEKDDSVRGVWVHFTQAEEAVNYGFVLNLWQSIAPPGEPSSTKDVLLYSMQAGKPVYTDSINGFHLYLFDSAIFTTKNFYVGWSQTSPFLLNIGLDRNYDIDNPNPRMFYNVNGYWKPSTVPGTMMMRPVVGNIWKDPLSVRNANEIVRATAYPNPATHHFQIKGVADIQEVYLFDMNGKEIRRYPTAEEYALDGLESGLYLVRIRLNNGSLASTKLIVE